MSQITKARVLELLDYEPATGVFRWKRSGRRAVAGAIAGSNNGKGYIQISIDGRRRAAHRLAWLVCTGELPTDEIDHIDGNRSNNAISNLRQADRFLNNRNVHCARATNKLGVLGVHARGTRFIAQIRANGTTKHLGCFKTLEAAHNAYLAAKAAFHKD